MYGYFPSADNHSALKVDETNRLILPSSQSDGLTNPKEPAFMDTFPFIRLSFTNTGVNVRIFNTDAEAKSLAG